MLLGVHLNQLNVVHHFCVLDGRLLLPSQADAGRDVRLEQREHRVVVEVLFHLRRRAGLCPVHQLHRRQQAVLRVVELRLVPGDAVPEAEHLLGEVSFVNEGVDPRRSLPGRLAPGAHGLDLGFGVVEQLVVSLHVRAQVPEVRGIVVEVIEVALIARRAEPCVGLHKPELPEDRADGPQPVERVPQAEVRERRVAAADEVVVVVQKLLLQALDVLEALRGEVIVVQRLDEARRERVDGHRGVLEAPGEERIDEPVRVQHQAVAIADASGRRELQPVGPDPVAHRYGVPKLRPDAREPHEELVELLLR